MFEVEQLAFNVTYPPLLLLHKHLRHVALTPNLVPWYKPGVQDAYAPVLRFSPKASAYWRDFVKPEVMHFSRYLFSYNQDEYPGRSFDVIGKWAHLYWCVRECALSPLMPESISSFANEVALAPEFIFEGDGASKVEDKFFQPSVIGALFREGFDRVLELPAYRSGSNNYHLHRAPATLLFGLWVSRTVTVGELYAKQQATFAQAEEICTA